MFGWITGVLALGVLVAALVGRDSGAPRDRSARATLDARLAADELGVDEHAHRIAVLEQDRAGRNGRTRRAVLAGIVVVLVVAAIGAVTWGMGGWPTGDSMPGSWSMGGHMGWSAASGTADEPVAGARQVTVTATDLAFAPASIEVEAGAPVNLSLVNDGAVFHDLSIPEFDFMLDAEPGQTSSGSLVVDEPGSYEFLCSVPGHANAGMVGTLDVMAP